jgi:regulator of protease activity HflC (stomatin/prohibitin superfamily)
MTRMFDEERIGYLLRVLRPVPQGWVQAAQELPAARRAMDEIVARAEADAEFQAALVADLEAALVREGYEPSRPLLTELRRRYARD